MINSKDGVHPFLRIERLLDNQASMTEWARSHAPQDSEELEENYKVEMSIMLFLRRNTSKGKSCTTLTANQKAQTAR